MDRPADGVIEEPGSQTQTRTRSASDTLRRAAYFAFRPTGRNVLHWSSWAVALGFELVLVGILAGGDIYGWELWLTRELQDVPGKRWIFNVTSTLTNTLSTPFYLLFVTIVAAVVATGHRGAAVILALSFPLHVLAQFPKALVDRPRPSPAFDGIEGVGGLQSFPSGHAEYVITFYGFLAYLVMLHFTARWQRAIVLTTWIAFALATGFGRVAEGRHWPLDVFASYIVGLGLLSGLIWLHTAFRYVKEGREHAKTV